MPGVITGTGIDNGDDTATIHAHHARRFTTAILISHKSAYKFFPGHAVCHASRCHAMNQYFSAMIYGYVELVLKKYCCAVGSILYFLLTDVASVVSPSI
jgi:hypothetical protein